MPYSFNISQKQQEANNSSIQFPGLGSFESCYFYWVMRGLASFELSCIRLEQPLLELNEPTFLCCPYAGLDGPTLPLFLPINV